MSENEHLASGFARQIAKPVEKPPFTFVNRIEFMRQERRKGEVENKVEHAFNRT